MKKHSHLTDPSWARLLMLLAYIIVVSKILINKPTSDVYAAQNKSKDEGSEVVELTPLPTPTIVVTQVKNIKELILIKPEGTLSTNHAELYVSLQLKDPSPTPTSTPTPTPTLTPTPTPTQVALSNNMMIKKAKPQYSITTPQPETYVPQLVEWDGSILTKHKGVNQGPSGKETYYSLPMEGIIKRMRAMGNNDEHWIREDGVHMLGNYVMIAANLNIRPRGSYVETSLGMGCVCDTGGFADINPTQIDIATIW